MKILALYLPQYHEISENNEWWGKGFTDWTNVKKAKPLYKGHIQPLVPMNKNYYDLSKVESIEYQVKLANKYFIDGFIFYHYWFSGKMLLEKPAEILLKNKQIKTSFAFCWANEPWARTWDGKDTEVLMPQNYSNKNDWNKHIKYFVNFFKDERYIKVNNKPMLYIYSTSSIPNFDEMINIWDEYLKKEGFEGLYLVEFISSKNPKPISSYSEAVTEFEPLYSNRFRISNISKAKRYISKKLKRIDFCNYDKVWSKILSNKRKYEGRNIQKGCFCSWDNSPRKGANSTIFKNATPEKFEKYLKKLVKQDREDCNNDFIVINAWNEWAEGTVLEPSEQFEYKYLEAVKKIKEEEQNEKNN